ncbi:MAG: MlaD family protein [Pseudomonadota bacterium]
METRANYVLIGAFTIAGFLGVLGFFLWFARVELDRQFAYYDVIFPTVSGLSNASEVRFSGLLVGRVIDVRLDPALTGQVIVRLEVQADTPVRTSSKATIESLGVTGVAYVGISAGNSDDPLLVSTSDTDVPVIESGRSVLQTLSEGAPEVIDEVLQVARNVSEFLGPETLQRVRTILSNVETASANLDRALDDFSAATSSISDATGDFAVFSNTLETLSASLDTTLKNADATLQQITQLAERAETTLDRGDEALASGRTALDAATQFLNADVGGIVEDVETTLTSLQTELERLGADTSATLESFRTTSNAATDRLRQSEATITAADKAFEDFSEAVISIEGAATQFEEFVEGEGAALVRDARGLVANATTLSETAIAVAKTDLPQILADIRTATDTVAQVVQTVGADLQTAAGRTDEFAEGLTATLDSVAATFETANGTLERLNVTLETGDAALAAAEGAFASADGLLSEDGDIVIALKQTLAQLEEAIGLASDDIPVITQQLRETAEAANAAFGEVESTAARLGPSLTAFATEGLPQYSRLAREARDLVSNLRQLVRQIERDPARYFLGRSEPEFRR